ncbi:MAG: ABC transporter permease [Ardenticatenales bacterium]|nr:ABC transporter permease [Ardenticatenales bacterium]
MILRHLIQRRLRSALTVLGVALGIAAIVVLTAVAGGLASGIGDLFGGSDADLTVTQAEAYDPFISSLDEQDGEIIRAQPQVADVAGILYSAIPLGDIPFFVVFGYEPDRYAIGHFKVTEGRTLSDDREIVLGKGAARNLKLGVGDTLRIADNAFRIVGVFETGQSFEEAGGVMTLSDAQALFKRPRQVNLFQVKLRAPDQAAALRDRLADRMPQAQITLGTGAGQRLEIYAMLEAFALMIGLVAALVGGLGMMNTIFMGVFERVRDIGVLRALGWRRRHVVWMIVAEALLLSGTGGVLGSLFGWLLLGVLNRLPAFSSMIVASFAPSTFLEAGVVAFGMGLVAAWVPAAWAARLPPIEALRYEGGVGGAQPLGAWATRLPAVARNLLRRRGRTVLTAGGIAIGVMIVVLLDGLTQGVSAQFNQVMGEGAADLAIAQADLADLSLSTLDAAVGQRVATMADVEAVAGMVMGFVSTPEMPMLIVFGLEADEFTVEQFTVVEGRRPSARGEAMLGRPAAEGARAQLGDVVRISGRPFKVVGLYESGVGYQDMGAVVGMREAQDMFEKPRQVSFYQVRLRRPEAAATVMAEIERRFPETAVSRSSELVDDTADFQRLDTIMTALSSIAVIVGSVGVVNTILMSVLERTREIGVLRAVGWRRRRVIGQIAAESLLLGAFGGAIGTVLGMILLALITLVPTLGALLAGAYTPSVFVKAAVVSLGLGALGSVYPAWRASRIAPAEALRYE